VLAVIGSSIWTWTIEQVDGLDWIFFQFKLDKTGHGLLIFGSYLDSFYLDMDFDPFPGVLVGSGITITFESCKLSLLT